MKKFFEEYMFRGKKKLPTGECDFSLEVFKYYPEKGLFIASGEDEDGCLSSIIGVINPKSENEVGVEMRQTVFSRAISGNEHVGYVLDGSLLKTEKNIVLSGLHEPDGRYMNCFRLPFELEAAPRGVAYPGQMDMVKYLVLPKKE